jgi:hypothetical protein
MTLRDVRLEGCPTGGWGWVPNNLPNNIALLIFYLHNARIKAMVAVGIY